jgi:ABC-2 type transport system ATP-binding protein
LKLILRAHGHDPALPLIEINNLRFGYGRQALFEQFALRLSNPGLYGLFGRNGSGKSTLLKLMAGLLFRRAGTISVSGRDPQRRHPDFLSSIYLVPEEFHLPNLSCERLAKLQAGFYPSFSREVFDHSLATFDVDPQTPFERMSLGGKKKAVIAFALSTLTPVLLLDEPTNGMDIVGRDQFRQLLRRPEQANRIILISTHQAHDLEQVISEILFIDQGRLALASPMEKLAQALRMGVVDGGAAAALEGAIYQESIGAQTAYISARAAADPIEPIQLELLYRALCRAPAKVLSAVSAGAKERV